MPAAFSRRGIAALGFLVALLVGGPAAAETRLSPAEMRRAAVGALRAGDAAVARELAAALVRRDAGDRRALVLLSRAERGRGRFGAARRAARQAWALAESPDERYWAAMAQALASDGARTRAQWWLRRAAEAAPGPRAKARAVRDLRYVRARNPLSTRLRFSVAPSSNINNGATAETVEIAGLPFLLSGDARALSGVELRFGGESSYRRTLGQGLAVEVGGEVDARRYRLSSDAREQAPDVEAGDLAFTSAELRIGGEYAAGPGIGPVGAELEVGRSWYGGAPLADRGRVSLSKVWRMADDGRVRAEIGAERRHRRDAAARSATVLTGQMRWRGRLANGDALALSLGVRETESDSAAIAHDAVLAGLRYRLGRPVAGARIGLALDLEAREYEAGLFGGPPREDLRAQVGVSVFLPRFEHYGFAPVVGVELARNRSSLDLYDRDTAGVTLGVRSAF